MRGKIKRKRGKKRSVNTIYVSSLKTLDSADKAS